MKIVIEQYNECWEIRFNDGKFNLAIAIEDDCAWGLHTDSLNTNYFEMPQQFLDMIKDEYKIKRPKTILPKMEEVRAIPF